MNMKSRWAIFVRDAVLSLALTWLLMYALAAVDRLPYSTTRDAIHDIVLMPGAFIAGVFYPQGIHTGRGSIGWAYVAVAGNGVFYALLWFLLIRIVSRIRQGRRLDRSNV